MSPIQAPRLIQTPRLLLRAPTPADLDALFRIYGDPRTHVYNPFGPCPDIHAARAMLDDWLAQWARNGFGQWAVALRTDPATVMGFGGISHKSYEGVDTLNLGYRLAPEAWGAGHATELARAGLAFAFSTLGLPKVSAIVRPANRPSIHVLEKIGMVRDGTLDDVPGQVPSLRYQATASAAA